MQVRGDGGQGGVGDRGVERAGKGCAAVALGLSDKAWLVGLCMPMRRPVGQRGASGRIAWNEVRVA
jgi:hypothetical protein